MPLASEILPLTRSVAHCPPVAHGPCWSPLPPPTANRPRPSAFPSPIPSPHRPNPSSPLTLPCSQIRSKNLHSFLSGPWEEDEIRRDRVEPQSVSLSWREPIPAGASGANGTEYEIRYYEKVGPGPRRHPALVPRCSLCPGQPIVSSSSQSFPSKILPPFQTYPLASGAAFQAGASSWPCSWGTPHSSSFPQISLHH